MLNRNFKEMNQKMKDDALSSYLPTLEPKNDLIYKKEYLFPFSLFKLSDNEIKLLQNPLRVIFEHAINEINLYAK